MTGKEIVEICKKHSHCCECELNTVYPGVCDEVMRDMRQKTPAGIYRILKKEYGDGEYCTD